MRRDVALRFPLLAIQAAKLIESNEKMDVFGELYIQIRMKSALWNFRKIFSLILIICTAFFLAAFARLRKDTTSFFMSVCPPARMEFGSLRTDLYEIWYFSIF
jgi:hypothetical protein